MKKTVVVLAALGFAAASQAGLVNWESNVIGDQPTFNSGDAVAMYIDVLGNNNVAGWQDAGLVVNADFTVNSGAGVLSDDIFAGYTTAGVDFGGGLIAVALYNLDAQPNNANIYTVLFDSATLSGSTLGVIADAATGSTGAASPPDLAVSYAFDGFSGATAGTMGGVTVIDRKSVV